jgi:PadR family transcriptional regulator, regulatory protein PadR
MPGPRCCRIPVQPGSWAVRARVERFAEPAVLLLLRERPMHGYELADRLGALASEDAVDLGNLYRLLRALEADAVVASEWHGDLPGPARRVYALNSEGHVLLDRWAEALERSQVVVADFLDRYRSQEVRR